MQVVNRTGLRPFLTGNWDPDSQNQEEMNFFADKILAHSKSQHFLLSDNENGDDPEIWYPYDKERHSLGTGSCEGGYYGLDLIVTDPRHPNLYHCYLGGSQGNSAPGFVVTEVEVL